MKILTIRYAKVNAPPLKGLAKFSLLVRRSDEDPVRIAAVANQGFIDSQRIEHMQSQPGHVLKTQAAIVVDLGVLEPRFEVGPLRRVGGQQTLQGVVPDLDQ